jgi:hypothetical protein
MIPHFCRFLGNTPEVEGKRSDDFKMIYLGQYTGPRQLTLGETTPALPIIANAVRQVINQGLETVFEFQEPLLGQVRALENRFLDTMPIGFQHLDHPVAGTIIGNIERNKVKHGSDPQKFDS